MIRTNEAVLLLNTSAPTFYKWVKKLGIELVSKIDTNGKASYIREEDFEELGKAMWKTIPTEQRSTSTNPNDSDDAVESNLNLIQEINDLKIERTTLSSQVKEFSGYVELYKEQLNVRETKVAELETERKNLYAQIIKVQVSLGTYKVLFYAIIAIVVLFGILFGLGVIQLGQ